MKSNYGKKAKKSAEIGMEELTSIITEAVDASVAKALKSTEEDAFKGRKEEGGIEEIIAEAVSAYNEDVKARKEEAGDEWSEDDDAAAAEGLVPAIVEAVSTAIDSEAKADEDEDGEEKSDGEEDDEEAKGHKALNTAIQRAVKSALSGRSAKQTQKQPAQRKYGNIYMGGRTMTSTQKKAVPADVQLARAIKCLDVFGRHDPESAAYYAQKMYSDENMTREFKALNATNPSSGGYLIPEVYLDQIIEMLYSKTVIFQLGAQKVPMSNGNLNIPKMTGGARATWGGEQRKISKTQGSFGNIKLSAKRLEAIVPQTRELLMSTSYSADQLFANDLTRRMELGLDFGALFGTGGEFQPLGISKNKDVEIIDCGTLNNAALVASGKITADFPVYVRSKAMAKNIDDQNCGWVFNSMFEGYLMNLKTSTGAYIYRDEMQGGKLLGFVYKVSNQIQTDSNNKTELIFGNWADLLVGEQLGLETYTTLDGSWTDDAGAQHNAFEENLAATRALMYIDIAARHPESFIYVKNAVIA